MNCFAILPSPPSAAKFANCLWLKLASGRIFLAQDSDYRAFCAAVAGIGGTVLPGIYDASVVPATTLAMLAPINPPANATAMQVAQAAALLNPGFAPS